MKKKSQDILIIALALFFSCTPATKNTESKSPATSTSFEVTGEVARLNDAINSLISPEARIEILAKGFNWSEGPVWVKDGSYLLFSDVPENTIYKWSEENGIEEYLNPSGYTSEEPGSGEGSNGLIINSENKLVLCQHGDRRVAVMAAPLSAPETNYLTIVDNFNGLKFNSPNDADFDSNNNLFFTDPPYGLKNGMDDPGKELEFQGVYRYSNSGELSLVTDKLSRPNGLGLSHDDRTLYVANSDPERSIWMAYELDEEGKMLNERVFYDVTGAEGTGLPDGLEIDKQGNIWATGPGGVWVFSPDGEVLARVITGQATSNCTFNEDESVLYMTCDDYLMRLILKPAS